MEFDVITALKSGTYTLLIENPFAELCIPFLNVKKTSMEGKKILMIDDDTCFLEVMKYFLEMERYRFTGLDGTNDIIRSVRLAKPDLVLLDYLLPYKNGADLCCRLRGCRGFEGLPIVLTSAFSQKQLSLDNVPFSLFIPKPFDLWYFLACMKKLLRHQVVTAA